MMLIDACNPVPCPILSSFLFGGVGGRFGERDFLGQPLGDFLYVTELQVGAIWPLIVLWRGIFV